VLAVPGWYLPHAPHHSVRIAGSGAGLKTSESESVSIIPTENFFAFQAESSVNIVNICVVTS